MKNFTKILFAALLCISSVYALAQQNDTLKIKRNTEGEITFVRFKPDSNRSMQEAINFLKTVLHAGPNDEFRLIKKNTDAWGFTHLKYQQYYKGIKVENGEYLIHGKICQMILTFAYILSDLKK